MPGTKFMFSTGIENSYPTIILPDGTVKRVDEMEKCGHYEHWETDFQLVKELGIEYLTIWASLLFSTHVGPGKYDWDFTDEAFNQFKRIGNYSHC